MKEENVKRRLTDWPCDCDEPHDPVAVEWDDGGVILATYRCGPGFTRHGGLPYVGETQAEDGRIHGWQCYHGVRGGIALEDVKLA